MNMNPTESDRLEQHLSGVDKKLDQLRRQNEISRLQNEMFYLDRQLRALETGHSMSEYSLSSEDRHDPNGPMTTPGAGQHTSSPNTNTVPSSRPEGFDELPTWVSPIKLETPGRGPTIDDRFVTKRKKVDFQSQTPSHEEPTSTSPGLKFNTGPNHGAKIKPATYDGTGSWHDYIAHFEACAKINHWTDSDKGLYLSVSLRGQAQGVLGNLSDRTNDFHALSTALEERFAPPNQTELYRCQLKDRRQKASENLAELAQDIRRLTNLAYPSAPSDVKETLSKEQFIDSLHSSDIRLKVKQARPMNLNDAVHHAIELEAYYRAEQKNMSDRGILYATDTVETKPKTTEMQQMMDTLTSLQNEFRTWKEGHAGAKPYTQSKEPRENTWGSKSKFQGNETSDRRSSGSNQRRRCYECGSEEHLRSNCPKLGRDTKRYSKPKGDYRARTDKDSGPKNNSQKDGDKSGVKLSNFQGSGLYVAGKLAGRAIDCLVDTGATLTLISPKVWDNVKDGTVTLSRFDKELVSASGDPINIQGKTPVQLEINGMQFQVTVVVADIDNDMILGLDFLQAEGGMLDLVKSTLSLRGQSIKLSCSGSIGCYRVVVAERTEVPARAEIIVQGTIQSKGLGKETLCLIEPEQKMYLEDGPIVAKTLVRGEQQIPLRVMNLSNETQTVHPGTHIATASQVTEVEPVALNVKRPCSRNVPAHLQDLYERTAEGLDPKQRKDVASLLKKYADVFSDGDSDIGRTGIIKHKIDTGDSRPVKQPLRRVPMHMNSEVDSQIEQMLEKDVIQPSRSPWASGIVLVKKKDGSMRFCVDYRRLNDITIKDAYPLPRTDECLNQLAGNSWFSCLDLNCGYWQVEVDETDREKTAFTSRKGLFEFKVMPFGLCNAPATFERLMETVLAGLQWEICLIYLDDVIVTGATFEAMIDNLSKVFERFRQAGLKLKPKKCSLFSREVEFLGHIVTPDGIHTDPKKTEAIETWPEPKCVKDVRSFLGLCSYYRRFIFLFAEIAKPLHKLTEKGQKFKWSEECSEAFQTLKQKLTEAPLLAHPDFNEQFILDTDASHTAIGAVLSQKIDGVEHVIAYGSRTLSKSERKYCVTRKEMLALVHFVKHFRHYLYGKKFLLRTDHSSLKWLLSFKDPEGQVARWIEALGSYDMKIEHRPGRLHKNADGMSRRVCKQCGLDCYVPDQVSKVAAASEVRPVSNTGSEVDPELKELSTAQAEDEDLKTVRNWVEQGSRPEQKDIAGASYFMKSLWGQFDRLQIRDELLVRRWDVLGTDLVYWQALVPLSQRRTVLRYSHDIKASGHLGIKKTLHKVRQRYYWPCLQRDVKIYVNGCEACAKRKGPGKTKRAPMQVSRSGYPMERIAVDILGELPLTEDGYKYILVVSDYFTKWTESYPMPNMEASTVAKVMVEQLVCRFGIPGKIHSDQGRQFESKLFSEMCKLLQVGKTRTTPYHPESDGMVERFNRTLCEMLSAYVQENQKDWDKHLPFVMMAYRAAEHETTGMSPNMLMLGRETATPLDIAYEMPSCIKSVPSNQWVWELQDRLESAHRFVREYTGRSIQRQKKYHDSKLSFEKFDRDDRVYVYFPVKRVGTTAKFTPFWRGPFQVKERISDVLYKVDCGRYGSFQVIHVDRLRRAKGQVLLGEGGEDMPETEIADEAPVEPEILGESEADVSPEIAEPESDMRFGKRERKKPVWHDDYCFKIGMAETTVTEVVENQPKCEECGTHYKKRQYLKRHKKAKHCLTTPDETGRGSHSDSEVDLIKKGDPGLSRLVQEHTTPSPEAKTSRKFETSVEDRCSQVTIQMDSQGIQTDFVKSGTTGNQCEHCALTFEDVAMFYVHMGCHTCNQPFKCNVCGEQCEDRLKFQIHITRSHRQ